MTQFQQDDTSASVEKRKVAIALGSNVAPKSVTLEKAIGEIIKRKIGRILLISPFYKTEPFGVEDKQDWFVNGCLIMETFLKPMELLEELQKIENDFGRVRKEKWGARTLDIDILLYEDYESQNNPKLILPHPEMTKREFVLRPLVDMIPWIMINNKTAQDHLKDITPTDMKKVAQSDDNYSDIMEMYWELSAGNINPGTERAEQTMRELLGDYESKISPIIHIAGTNGKGSVAAITHKILNKAGKIVHRYTSPHLRKYSERFILGVTHDQNRFVSESEFEIAVSRLSPYVKKYQLSHFEALTCVALLIFSETPADYVILETGMGGRLDATNIFSKPAITAITSISFDHVKYLGDMIEAIAFEKAGIIKPNIPVVVGARDKDAQKVISQHAKSLSSPVSMIDRDWKIGIIEETEAFICNRTDEEVYLDTLKLGGVHQLDNAAISVEIVRHLIEEMPHDDEMDEAFSNVHWPARIERFTPSKAAVKFPKRTDLIIDGCHNRESVLSFVEYMKTLDIEEGRKPLKVLFSCKNDRNIEEIFSILSDLKAEFIFMHNSFTLEQMHPDKLIEAAAEFDMNFTVEESLYTTLQKIIFDEELILNRYAVCGSLYFCGSFYNMVDYQIDL